MLLEFQCWAPLKSGNRVKYGLAVVAAKNELRYRDRAIWLTVIQARPQLHDLLRIWKGQWSQQYSIYDAEDGRVCTDAEGQSQAHNCCEARAFAQHAGTVP